MAINDLDVFGANPIDVAGMDIGAVGDALKIKYNPKRVALIGYENSPLYGMLPKRYDFTGRNYVIDIAHTGGGGVGATVNDAINNVGNHENDAFVLTRVNKYAVNNISGDVWRAAQSDTSSMFDAYRMAWDAPIYEFKRDLCLEMYRDGTGVRGSFTTVGAGALTTITLDNPDDIVFFERNQKLDIRPDREGASGTLANANSTVVAVSRRDGTITLAGATQALAATTQYFLFREGMYTAAGTGNKRSVMGLMGWLPDDTVTLSTSFFGVSRDTDDVRLAGLFHDGSGKSVTEAVLDAGKFAYREGARPDHLFLNPEQMVELQKELQGKSFYEPTEAKATNGVVAYKGFKINAASGSVTVLSDPDCPVGRGFMLTLPSWKLASMGQAPQVLDLDGNTVLRAATEDAYQMRFGGYLNLGCDAPNQNVHIKFA